METRILKLILVLAGMVSAIGCAEFSHEIPQEQRNIQGISVMPQEVRDLAGLWEYADKTGSYPITLNAEGKGTYEWEEGRFETMVFEQAFGFKREMIGKVASNSRSQEMPMRSKVSGGGTPALAKTMVRWNLADISQ